MGQSRRPRGLIAEPLLEQDGALSIDDKFDSVGCEVLRRNFHAIARRALFGESCPSTGSDQELFAADWIDRELGAL